MRLMRVCLVVVFASFALLGARPADAMCSFPSSDFSPPTGTVLPASATVYLFVVREVPDDDAPPIALEVEGARFTARRIATMPVYDVVRIDFTAKSREVVIRWTPKKAYHHTEVRYPIGMPATAEARVTGLTHTSNAWACSHTNTIDVELTSNAIAYRLDWLDGTSEMIPADLGVLWNRFGRDEVATLDQRLEIGYVSCLGNTVEPKALATLREFRLGALFADGSERRFGPARARLDGDSVRLPTELLSGEPQPRPYPSSPEWPMIGAIAGLAAVAAAGILWRRRGPGDHVPRY